MAAYHNTQGVPAGGWALITSGAAANLTFQNQGRNYLLVQGSVGAVEPTSTAGAIRYNPGQGERNVVLAELFPGISGVDQAWAWAEDAPGLITSSHA